ncbi:MAG: alpha/beta fold hydrolase [Thermoguttaceae bacterium]|nr:alpha/beta fold hydrolase [Thermoguttaceae bacterium]
MKKFLVDDTTYCATTKGSGPVLLFAHGFPFDGRLFQPVVDRLATRFFCVALDLRGFGGTPLGSNGHNSLGAPRVKMGRFADDLAILGSELDCELGRKNAKIFVCGLSMGGYILLEFLRRRPQMLAGAIFCDSNAKADSEEKAKSRLYLAETIDSFGVRNLAENTIPTLISPKTAKNKPEVVETLREMISSQSALGIAAASRGMAVRRDLTDLLPTIEVPTLVLGGEDDSLSPPESLDEIASAIPSASRATIPNAGHVPPLENPDAFANAILEWHERIA